MWTCNVNEHEIVGGSAASRSARAFGKCTSYAHCSKVDAHVLLLFFWTNKVSANKQQRW
mgnify:CR=1 FL=1